MAEPLLSIRDLSVDFSTPGGVVHAVRQISFDIGKGETLALVGESGSGKSVTALSVLQLLPYPVARHPGGSVIFEGAEMMGAPQDQLRAIRGKRISMIFQDPMTALNPYMTVGDQLIEPLRLHEGLSKSTAHDRALAMLDSVGIQDGEKSMRAYPHQFSGGMRQRVMIAMALITRPELLIADEPTTALDVTVQAQILDLISEMQREIGMAVIAMAIGARRLDRLAEVGRDVEKAGGKPFVQSKVRH